MKMKVAVAVVVLLGLAGSGLTLFARSVLTGDNVRQAVAAQIAAAIGQPVTIGGLDASVYPRVTLHLTGVVIGQPAAIELQSMRLATDLRALVSRRIERATVRIEGARVTLPLPELGRAQDGTEVSTAGSPPVEIVSINEIVLRGAEIVRGDRTLRADIELVPQGEGVQLRRVVLAADQTTVELTGVVTSLSPLDGRIEASAEAVNFDRLLAFLGDFAGSLPPPGASTSPAPSTRSSSSPGIDGRLTFVFALGSATTGALELEDLRGTAVVTPGAVVFDPTTFSVFGGRYAGSIELTVRDISRYRWRGTVRGIDTPALMAFAGSPNTISGTLAGSVALESAGLAMDDALRAARGTARIDIADGSIALLSLLRTVVLATSGRGGYATSAASAVETRGDGAEAERFSRLGATLSLADGIMRTSDFSMNSTDVDLTGSGTVRIETMMTNLEGEVRLSEDLSKKGGTDLYRYTQQDGRVTLPATVSGPLAKLSVRIDLAEATGRAIRNRAVEEAEKAIERNLPGVLGGLGGKIRKRPPR
jgi:uncharacterized protein involved in outer membrane biogenesis